MSDEAPAIGIDLGTTKSCAAVLKDNKIVLIPGDDVNNSIASFVFFEKSGSRQIGNLGKNNAFRNPENGIFGTKRFTGRTYDEFQNENLTSMFPYIVENKNNKPQIVVKCENGKMCFYVEEISAMILNDLKERAEEYIGKKVTKAVITVPAHFNGTQRQATIDAGRIAGLEVLCIINEPTAAVIASELLNKYKDKICNVLVYDFGGGTFDVSIATVHNGDITIKASNGEANLGGNDLDDNLIEYFLQNFYKEHKIDLKESVKAVERLRQQAVKTKILLSSTLEHTVELDNIYGNINFKCRVTRDTFEKINKDLFEKTFICIKKTLKDASVNKKDIHEILFVGGSTRIPFVRDLVKHYFNKEPNCSVHPEEAVSIGAARQAAIFDAQNGEAINLVKIIDVCSFSFEVKVQEGPTSIIIPRNTKLPFGKTKKYCIPKDFQDISININEIDGYSYVDNKMLAKINVKELTLKEEIKLNVKFNVNENGILYVEAKEESTENGMDTKISIHSNNLCQDEIRNMITKIKKFNEDDKKKKEVALYRNILEDKYYNLKILINKITNSIEKQKTIQFCEEINKWLSSKKTPTLIDIKSQIDDIEKCLNFTQNELAIEEIWQ